MTAVAAAPSLVVTSATAVTTDAEAAVWMRLWLMLGQSRTSRPIALVPVDGSVDVGKVSAALVQACLALEGVSLRVVAAQKCPPAQRAAFAATVATLSQPALIVLDPLLQSPEQVPTARAAPSALLLVGLNHTDLRLARQTRDLLPADRWLGCIPVPALRSAR